MRTMAQHRGQCSTFSKLEAALQPTQPPAASARDSAVLCAQELHALNSCLAAQPLWAGVGWHDTDCFAKHGTAASAHTLPQP